MRTDADINKYNSNYKKEKYRNVVILIPREDEKTINYLAKQKPLSGYIRRLIKEDIENERIEKARAANK